MMQQSEKTTSSFSQSPSRKFRYRKLDHKGMRASAYPVSMQRVQPKQMQVEFPIPEKRSTREETAAGFKPQIVSVKVEQINLRALQQEYFRRYRAEGGIKSLLRAYDESKKRSESAGMQKLGLDVIKIESYNKNSSGSSRQGRGSGHKASMKQLQHKYLYKRQFLLPIKSNSAREAVKDDPEKEYQLRNFINLASSLGNFSHKYGDSSSPQFRNSHENSPQRRVIVKEKRPEDYLYKRLQGTENKATEDLNCVYERRIKSYQQLLWKLMVSHNIYINLDLKPDDLASRPKKLKAYVAPGNNGAMIRSLIGRRFWWSISEERTADCDLVWTQIKVNQVLGRQERGKHNISIVKPIDDESPAKISKTSKAQQGKKLSDEEFNSKVMSIEDIKLYRRYRSRYQGGREKEYSYKAQKIGKQLQRVEVEAGTCTIHNHLPNNFYLGNKKALFYNLKQYYALMREDVYSYLPLTFHIRKGQKDPEYLKFIDYYKRRARVIAREAREEQEGEAKAKKRNIWIVKPGQNSNQGRGITVIDQIYELNSIMKQGERQHRHHGPGSKLTTQQTERTYIVQMYIDRPLLYHNRKFDIRHYMIITHMFGGMKAYWYQQGYIRTSSYQFTLQHFEAGVHLTNDAVQKRQEDYQKYQPFNKLSYEEFQRYLDATMPHKKYNFKQQILPQMKIMATDAARSVFTKIAPQNNQHNFEVFGLDFMIDRQFKPWLIEINTNPCLDCASPLLNRIIPYMVEGAFRLSIDLAHPPPSHYPNSHKHLAPQVPLETLKYELIFDSVTQGATIVEMYKRVRSRNILEQIGEIEDDEEFKDEGKQCKLDDAI